MYPTPGMAIPPPGMAGPYTRAMVDPLCRVGITLRREWRPSAGYGWYPTRGYAEPLRRAWLLPSVGHDWYPTPGMAIRVS